MRRLLYFAVGTIMAVSAVSSHAASPRATLIEARDLAYDANYRNDQSGLRSAIATLQTLTGRAEEGAYAHYYLSWTYWALAASQFQEKDVKGALDSAGRAVEHARTALTKRDKDSEVYTALANALIVIAVLDHHRFAEVAPEIKVARQKALELGPDNPRAVMMEAGMLFNNPPERGGGHAKGIARWKDALRLFEAEADAKVVDQLAPRWGQALAHGWLASMYLATSPPQKDNAREAAETALRMRPDFWYVREQVLPQLR